MRDFGDDKLKRLIENRPAFPKRAVVTGGMPYGGKELHFGHVGGMFVHADALSRFLKDRIGQENVIFVSGTDCYGSPILESYRNLQNKENITLQQFVERSHVSQKQTLENYEIGLDEYLASSFGSAKNIHDDMSNEILNKLYNDNKLEKLSALQFFDEEKQVFLNGRQVMGKCPFENCQSEHAYADECSLGHQYMPVELIDPISKISNKKPLLKNVENWYFKLEDFVPLLTDWINLLEKQGVTRSFVIKEIKEFLKAPEVYVKNEFVDEFNKVANVLPPFSVKDGGNKSSQTYVFGSLKEREEACLLLTKHGVRYRTGKTLVPFRLTGNCEWGVAADTLDGVSDQTFWVWPESLWAPISFTKTHLKKINSAANYKDWWCSKDSAIYQVIGEDNIYFYGPAQHAIWMALSGSTTQADRKEGELQLSNIIANKHILFLNTKASSSGKKKPPMANELLEHYTAEQLRCHFLGLNLGNNSASFNPKIFSDERDLDIADPVLKEGNLLTNVFNRTLRSLFYAWQKYFDGVVPVGVVDEEIAKKMNYHILNYERHMYQNKFHMAMYEIDSLVRDLNKYYVREIGLANEDAQKISAVIVNTLYMAKTAMVLLHPIVPKGAERVCEKLKMDKSVFSWDNIEKPVYDFFATSVHKPELLIEREDFFKKHPSQFNSESN